MINATGVILHTNLGRAPLSAASIQACIDVAGGYSNLEFDLKLGKRGSRLLHAETLLKRLTGAEAALVVNNNAAAVLLVLSALARRRGVVIARTQLVEIGGGFPRARGDETIRGAPDRSRSNQPGASIRL